MPRTVTQAVRNETSVSVAETNSCVFLRDSPSEQSSRYPRNVGMKATEMLFSANSRRKRFGIINAIPNASAYALVPRKAAFVISRISPIIRDAKVITESSIPDFNKDVCFAPFCCAFVPFVFFIDYRIL